MSADSAGAVREALLALPEGTSHGVPLSPSRVYLPPSHLKALNPDVQLVTGMRGAGKTFWWSALQEGAVRELIGRAVERPPLNENTEVRTGFGPRPAPDGYPGADRLRGLLADFEPKTVWRRFSGGVSPVFLSCHGTGPAVRAGRGPPVRGMRLLGGANAVRRGESGRRRPPVPGTRRRVRLERRVLSRPVRCPGPLRR